MATSEFRKIKESSYIPGALLRRAVATPYVVASFEYDNISEVSTTDSPRASKKSEGLETSGDEASKQENLTETTSAITLPSVGSAGHDFGSCKPCGFFHKGGCHRGIDCQFCHLCPPGSIEDKRKTKRKMVRAQRLQVSPVSMPAATTYSMSMDSICRMTR